MTTSSACSSGGGAQQTPATCSPAARCCCRCGCSGPAGCCEPTTERGTHREAEEAHEASRKRSREEEKMKKLARRLISVALVLPAACGGGGARLQRQGVSATVHLPSAHAQRDRGAPHRGAREDAAYPRPVLRRVGGSARWLVRRRLLSTGLQRGGLRRRQARNGQSRRHPPPGPRRGRDRHRDPSGAY